MPVEFAYLVGAICVALVVAYFYRGHAPGFDAAALVVASLAGIPLGSLVSLAPILVLCLVSGPVT